MTHFKLSGKVEPSKEYWWVTDETKAMLNKGYLLKGESVKNAVRRITTHASNLLGKPELQPLFEKCIARGWWSFSSPVWANMGAPRALPISCHGVYIPDTLVGIILKGSEIALQNGLGGGTSGYFGSLRERGAEIKDNGETNGPVAFMRRQDTDVEVISQGGIRRGAFAGYIDIDHPDILEFLRIKDIGNPIQNLFTGVCIPDYWMKEMEAGDKDKRNIWAKVLESRQQKGIPYLFFSDNVNNNKPEIYKALDKKIHASNLCVAGFTEILTDKGEIIIGHNEGRTVNVWNGHEYSEVTIMHTGSGKTLTRVEVACEHNNTRFGAYLDCTAEHKWYLKDGTETRTSELEVGQELLDLTTPDGFIRTYKITSIEVLEGVHETFCFTEPKRHLGVFNGILTGQCSEIALSSDEYESFVCCLSSMNLDLFDEWEDTDAVRLMTYFLDAVITDFINKTEDMPIIQASRRFALQQRAIGIGVLGYHSYLQRNMIPFESMQAKFFNTRAFKHIQKQSKEASKELAEIYGPAPIFDEPRAENLEKFRNVTTMAVAPTTSSSSILGQVSPGIEPFNSNYYKVGLAKGEFMRKNRDLIKLLKAKNQDTPEVWREIMINGGSVQGLKFLTQDEKDVFKTFREISQNEILNQAIARQGFIDQAQSLNVNIPSSIPLKEVNKLYMDYWRNGGKTLYYQRSQSVAKELATNLVNCSSCEA